MANSVLRINEKGDHKDRPYAGLNYGEGLPIVPILHELVIKGVLCELFYIL